MMRLPNTASMILWMALYPLQVVTSVAVDIVAILPDRHSVYRNRLHNALLATARQLNVSMEMRDFGNYDASRTLDVLADAVATGTEDQPSVYCIWPPNNNPETTGLMRQLHETHNVTIIQMVSLPQEQDDWDYISAFVGIDADLLAEQGADILIRAVQGRNIATPRAAILGYPEDYHKGRQILNAFQRRLSNSSNVEVVETRFLPWGEQPAYDAVLDMFAVSSAEDSLGRKYVDAIYTMDDRILSGAYQALSDMKITAGVDITLVGSVCNGARELLDMGRQHGTVVESPSLIGRLAISTCVEYIETGSLSRQLYYVPTTTVLGKAENSWETTVIDFQDRVYMVDDLCTWTIEYERGSGITSIDQTEDICRVVDCEFIPSRLRKASYVVVGLVYVVAAVSAALLLKYRNKKLIQLAQPFFLSLVLAGACVDTTSIIFMSPESRLTEKQLDAYCVAWPWSLAMGHMMTTATLVTKLYRVKKVCLTGRNMKRARVTVKDVLYFLLAFLAYDIIVLVLWFAVDPFKWSLRISSADANGFATEVFGKCASSEHSSSWAFPALLVAGHIAALLYANVLGYQTLSVHKISDSKNVAIALLSSLEFLVLALPSMFLPDSNASAKFLIWTAVISLNNIWVIAFVVCPKLYACLRGRGDILPDGLSRRSSGKGGSAPLQAMPELEFDDASGDMIPQEEPAANLPAPPSKDLQCSCTTTERP